MNQRIYPVEHRYAWLEKLFQTLSPAKAFAREKARVQLAALHRYTGASKQRASLAQYAPGHGDANSDILWDLPILRERSRDLLRNNPLALGAVNTVCTNVVGTGLKLQARIDRQHLNLSDDAADELESTIEREFRLWANSTFCDVTRRLNFASLQDLVFRSVLENGDVFVLLSYAPRSPREPYQFGLQVMEADRICNANHAPNTDTLIAGVEINAASEAVAYHILKNHPGKTYGTSTPEWLIAQARNEMTGLPYVLHLYQTLREGQTRGVPYLAPVIESLKQLGDYTESEVSAALVSSYFTVFIKSLHGDTELTQVTGEKKYDLGKGAVVSLAEGEDVSTVNPGRPNAQFDPFVQSILRQIGVALEIPFEVLIKHFTASYSAARGALLEAWRSFMKKREWLVHCFCQPVYAAWFHEAVCRGRILAPGFMAGDPGVRAAYLGTHWIGPAPGQIDPLKEIQAARERIDAGISTLSRETAALTGEEWEKTHRQGVKEHRLREAFRVTESLN